MPFVVRAFPVLDGKECVVRELAKSMSAERAAQTGEFFARFGVCHESWHLQETPAGVWVIVVTEIDQPGERAKEYSASTHDFDSWFKSQVLALTGIDPFTQPLGPPTEGIFAWPASS
jgi:hypothetical protein